MVGPDPAAKRDLALRRRKPVAYPNALTIRLSDYHLRKLNHCSDIERKARATIVREWIEQRLDSCCPEPAREKSEMGDDTASSNGSR